MPENMSEERKKIIRALGAELVLTDPKLSIAGSVDKAMEMAAQIAAQAPLAVRAAKECINAEWDMTADEAIACENHAFGECFSTADQKGGMRAFLDKSKYEFQGK